MSHIIYLDESGDLGWSFAAPFRAGGSSRHLTISAVCTPEAKEHLPKRVIRDLYTEFNWHTNREKKWVEMSEKSRGRFAVEANKLVTSHPEICLRTITVKKENVMAHIRADSNKLYNYMICLCLSEHMAQHERVTLIPDPRSLKVKSGNSLHDYLQVDLWFYRQVKTALITKPQDSKKNLNIQFADMLAGLVWAHYEDGEKANYMALAPKIRQKCLYFK